MLQTIKIEQTSRTLKQLETPPFFIVLSTKIYIYLDKVINDYQQRLEKEYKISFEKQFRVFSFNGNETTEDTLYSAINTKDIFTPYKFIIVRHADELIQKIISNKKSLYYFKNSIENPIGSIYCILHFSTTNIKQEVQKLFLTPYSILIEEGKIFDYKIPKMLFQLVIENNFQTDITTMQLLAQKNHYQFNMAHSMLQSLYAFCIKSRKITLNDVQEVCFSLEGNLFFRVLEHLTKREIKQSIQSIFKHQTDKLHTLNISMQKIWFSVIRSYSFIKTGTPISYLQKKLEVTPYYYKHIASVLKHYSEEENIKILKLLFEQYENLQTAKNAEEKKEYLIFFLIEVQKL